MTTEELKKVFDSGKIEWATIDNHIHQVISDCDAKFKSDIEAAFVERDNANEALNERKAAIEKALVALQSKDPQAAIVALDAISATRRTERDKEVEVLNGMITELQRQIADIQAKIAVVQSSP